ncbi:MAG TPA: hypothetical protein VJ385_11865 [Fibrobacteria bacterium]|nr:hypothetical protein [Fibrobacteria bacterium]
MRPISGISQEGFTLRAETGLRGFGGHGAKPQLPDAKIGGMVSAFLKSSSGGSGKPRGLGKSAAGPENFSADLNFEGDTAWFVRDDSARGRIYWIHVFHDSEEDLHALVHDSLVYMWPFDGNAPVLLSSDTYVRHADGSVYHVGITGGDGKGISGEAAVDKTLRVLWEWLTVSADTAWKSSILTQTGPASGTQTEDPSTYFDSGEGQTVCFADSTFIGGKVAAWIKTYDGDGDGLVLSARSGGRVVVNTESFAVAADGTRTLCRNAYGPGKDGEFFTSADNPIYPFSAILLSALGDTLSISRNGDADGDGYYIDPASNTGNRVWETSMLGPGGGFRSYRDSTVKTLNDPIGDGNERIDFYAAEATRMDGSEARISVEPKQDRAGFTASDTVLVREWRGPQTGRDSTLHLARIIPGNLTDPADDKVIEWSEHAWYGSGGDLTYASWEFTARGPVLSGADPERGILVHEERYARTGMVAGRWPVRSWRKNIIDLEADAGKWEERRFFSDGDSLAGTGRSHPGGTGEYSFSFDGGMVNSGRYDAVTGAFQDTIRYPQREDGGTDYDVCEGVLQPGNGTGDYKCAYSYSKGEVQATRVILAGVNNGLSAAFLSEKDSGTYRIHEDTAVWKATRGNAASEFAIVTLRNGIHEVTVKTFDPDGAKTAEGKFTFTPDGLGTGTRIELKQGRAVANLEYSFEFGRTMWLDGIEARLEGFSDY